MGRGSAKVYDPFGLDGRPKSRFSFRKTLNFLGNRNMGRPRKSPMARRLEGNPGKRPIPESAVSASGTVIAPDHLSDDATACIETIKRSLPPKTYASCDTFLLAAYATAWAEHKRCVEEVNRPEFGDVECLADLAG